MFLAELSSWKNELARRICDSKDIRELLATPESPYIEDGEDLMYSQVFPYSFMPDIQKTTKPLICFEVEVTRPGDKNELYKWNALHVYVLVHNKDMRMDGGTRIDILADKIHRLLDRDRDFALCKGLKLLTVKRFIPNDQYFGIELYYEGLTFDSDSCTPRGVE